MKKRKLNHKKVFFVSAVLLIVFLGITFFFFYESEEKEFHIHTDFKVYLDSGFYDFSSEEYMSVQGDYRDLYLHLHDSDGEIIHYHKEGLGLVEFFSSLGVTLNDNCFVFEGEVCDSSKELNFYVNGERVNSVLNYVPKDLDRLLIVYSSKEDLNIEELFSNVTDRACIQSGECPERGDPFDESSCGPDSCVIDLS